MTYISRHLLNSDIDVKSCILSPKDGKMVRSNQEERVFITNCVKNHH